MRREFCGAHAAFLLWRRTDNAVKNRWAALVKKNPRLADDESSGTATGGLHVCAAASPAALPCILCRHCTVFPKPQLAPFWCAFPVPGQQWELLMPGRGERAASLPAYAGFPCLQRRRPSGSGWVRPRPPPPLAIIHIAVGRCSTRSTCSPTTGPCLGEFRAREERTCCRLPG